MKNDSQNTTTKSWRPIIPLLLLAILITFAISTQWTYISNYVANIKQEIVTELAEIDFFGEKPRARLAEVQTAKREASQHINQLETKLIETQNKNNAAEEDTRKAITGLLEINDRLRDLAANIDSLPLASEAALVEVKLVPEHAIEEEDASIWFQLKHELLQDIQKLIHIQKASSPSITLLPPSEIIYIHENLKLKIMLAQISLLSHDKNGFSTDLKATIDWINQYYDKKSEPVVKLLQELNQLHDDMTGINLPNVSARLDAIQNYRLNRNEEKI